MFQETTSCVSAQATHSPPYYSRQSADTQMAGNQILPNLTSIYLHLTIITLYVFRQDYIQVHVEMGRSVWSCTF